MLQTVFADGSGRVVYFARPGRSTVLEKRVGGEWVEQPSWYAAAAGCPARSLWGLGRTGPSRTSPSWEVGVESSAAQAGRRRA